MAFKFHYSKIKIFPIFLFVLLTCNCVLGKKVPKYIREKFTNCYNGQKTGIDNLININGYYILRQLQHVCSGVGINEVCRDTTEINLLFYDDGTFLYNFYDLYSPYPGNTVSYLEAVCKNKKTAESFYSGFFWGIYRIEKDTIITQYIFNEALLAPWNVWEDKYLVIDRNTISKIPSATKPLFNTTKKERELIIADLEKKKFLFAQFRNLKSIPPPNSWVKKESWTKCK